MTIVGGKIKRLDKISLYVYTVIYKSESAVFRKGVCYG